MMVQSCERPKAPNPVAFAMTMRKRAAIAMAAASDEPRRIRAPIVKVMHSSLGPAFTMASIKLALPAVSAKNFDALFAFQKIDKLGNFAVAAAFFGQGDRGVTVDR